NPWAGLFLAIHTFAVKYTSVIYLEALPLFLSLTSVYLFYRYINNKTENVFAGKRWWMLSAVALGLAVASKYLYGLVGAAIAMYYGTLLLLKKEKNWKVLLLWGVMSIAAFFVADPVLWTNPIQAISRSIGFHFNYSGSDAVVNSKNYPFWQPLVWLSLSIPQHNLNLMPFFVHVNNFWITLDSLIVIPAIAGLYRLFKKYPLYFVWLVLGLICLLIWKVKWPQYILLIIVPYCLAAGLGIECIIQQCRGMANKLWNKIAQ
ncbi:MAG: glycosyltransferase family 39 protein, partial [Anaerolineae bacterium]|nr:glycosyltransferase family 39 protein [Anaerolineae bacterium]